MKADHHLPLLQIRMDPLSRLDELLFDSLFGGGIIVDFFSDLGLTLALTLTFY